jgi:hypothetical protein
MNADGPIKAGRGQEARRADEDADNKQNKHESHGNVVEIPRFLLKENRLGPARMLHNIVIFPEVINDESGAFYGPVTRART